jgi:hypothetical protein
VYLLLLFYLLFHLLDLFLVQLPIAVLVLYLLGLSGHSSKHCDQFATKAVEQLAIRLL